MPQQYACLAEDNVSGCDRTPEPRGLASSHLRYGSSGKGPPGCREDYESLRMSVLGRFPRIGKTQELRQQRVWLRPQRP